MSILFAKRVLATGTLAAALLTAGLTAGPVAFAQGPPPPPGYGPNNMYAPDSVTSLIEKTRGDLDQAYHGYRFRPGDQGRLNHAEERLRDFARKWHRGHFDKGELDDAIGSIQHVLDNNRMPPEVRGAVDTDVSQLRGMREAWDRHELVVR